MQSHLEKCGVRFMLGDTAASFDKNTAHMKSGRDVEFDVLILAVGVRANSALVKDAGGDAGRGIVIDGPRRFPMYTPRATARRAATLPTAK